MFRAWKFRSMVPDAERNVGAMQAAANDSRVTRVGRLMRATAMDELPQLWSIFSGDMSFVGPRALRPGEIEASGDGRSRRSKTCLASRSGTAYGPGSRASRRSTRRATSSAGTSSGTTGVYIRRPVFWLDVRLIALSFWITFRGKWEVRTSKI